MNPRENAADAERARLEHLARMFADLRYPGENGDDEIHPSLRWMNAYLDYLRDLQEHPPHLNPQPIPQNPQPNPQPNPQNPQVNPQNPQPNPQNPQPNPQNPQAVLYGENNNLIINPQNPIPLEGFNGDANNLEEVMAYLQGNDAAGAIELHQDPIFANNNNEDKEEEEKIKRITAAFPKKSKKGFCLVCQSGDKEKEGEEEENENEDEEEEASDEDMVELPYCGHQMHLSCLRGALKYSKKCPVCRLDYDMIFSNVFSYWEIEMQRKFFFNLKKREKRLLNKKRERGEKNKENEEEEQKENEENENDEEKDEIIKKKMKKLKN